MVVEIQAEHLPTFDFRYIKGDHLRTDDMEVFRHFLDQLLARELPVRPERPGAFLLLQREAVRYNRLQTFLRIADRLVKNGFHDMWNWQLDGKNNPIIWWTNRLAFDVVGLPAYSTYKGRNFRFKDNSYSYRLFTRPSYISQTGEQKKQ